MTYAKKKVTRLELADDASISTPFALRSCDVPYALQSGDTANFAIPHPAGITQNSVRYDCGAVRLIGSINPELLTPRLTQKGLEVEAESFRPFALGYSLKDTGQENQGGKNPEENLGGNTPTNPVAPTTPPSSFTPLLGEENAGVVAGLMVALAVFLLSLLQVGLFFRRRLFTGALALVLGGVGIVLSGAMIVLLCMTITAFTKYLVLSLVMVGAIQIIYLMRHSRVPHLFIKDGNDRKSVVT